MIKRYKGSFLTAVRSWLCLFLVLLIIFCIAFFKVLPVVVSYAEGVSETLMLNSSNEAVLAVLKDENITYDNIAKLSRNAEGQVNSLEIDTYKINALKSRISNEISKIIDGREEYEISIPVGNLLNTPYTMGFGPRIPFKIKITTTAIVDFEHEFKDAGINQVLHLINIKIDIKGTVVAAWCRKSVNVKTTAIAAQTVIVGAVPDAFTNVIENPDDMTAGLINDYGALAGD